MPNLLYRLCGAVFAIPLALSRPLMKWSDARRRKTGAHRLRPPTAPAPGQGPQRVRLSSADMRAMRDEMRAVLDAQPSNRQAFRHLARFERKFSQRGIRAVEEVPVEQLRRALRDFEALVRNWSSPSLADLRSRMAVALADRSSAASVWIAANTVSKVFTPEETMSNRLSRHATTTVSFRHSQQVDVGDISMSRFEAAGREWQSTSAPA